MIFSLVKILTLHFYRYLLIMGLILLSAYGCFNSKKLTNRPAGYSKPYRVMGKWYQPIPHAKGFQQQGIASWYGKKFDGRKTSSGEIYNMYAVSAAHKTLPLGTYVRVLNLNNNKQIDVRINDRGPFVHGRIIDLSYMAAKKIGMADTGTAPVKIWALGVPAKAGSQNQIGFSFVPIDFYRGNFTIQVGAFSKRENAEKFKQILGQKFKNAHVTTGQIGNEKIYRVRVGRCTTLKQAVEYENIMIQNGHSDAFVVAE
ncbi:MAG: septal ring lytic transglycosylase RlpA family protein [Desulfobacterales bacterium]